MPIRTSIKTTGRIPSTIRVPREFFVNALDIVEKDIHQRVKAGKRLDGQKQTTNAPSTLRFKKKHGLGRTPLKSGWSPRGYHRFLAKFPRRYNKDYAIIFLDRSNAPGGFPGQAEVAGYLDAGVKRRTKMFLHKGSVKAFAGGVMTRTKYHVPFGISDRSAERIGKRFHVLLRRAIREQSRSARDRTR